tara:strand:- start:206 stop:634 length:429 start_codon:yes stop_codon:yes gene_type:complete
MKKLLLLAVLLVAANVNAQSKINDTYLSGFFNASEEKVKISGLLIDDGTVSGYGDKEISIQFMPYFDYLERIETYVTVEIKTPSGKLEVIKNVKMKYGNLYFVDWVQKTQTELKKVLVVNGVYKFSITKGYNWEFELKLTKF